MMRLVTIFAATMLLSSCASWNTLNTEDVLADARARSAQSSQANVLANWQEETFGSLANFPGQTFRGDPMKADGTPNAEAAADIQGWSWSADGRQIIIKHALEDGSYGGVTHVYPNGTENALGYTYVTNAGFETVGTFTLDEDGGWEAIETVNGHATITRVRSRGYVREDGALVSEADYLSGGRWTPGHGFVYTEFDGEVPELATSSGE